MDSIVASIDLLIGAGCAEVPERSIRGTLLAIYRDY